MDIKVITRHAPDNYGSLLQAHATTKVIQSMGYSCKIIDYQPDYERGLKRFWNIAFHCGFNKVKAFIYFLDLIVEGSISYFKFQRFRKKWLDMTEFIGTHQKLSKLKADIFMTGSDQVWGFMANQKFDNAYFLNFVDKNVKKIAYSASFGRVDFSELAKIDLKKYLSVYNDIAVREDSAVTLLNDFKLKNRGVVLDPVLLLPGKYWEQYAVKPKMEKYILVYQLHPEPELNNYVEKLAKKTGLEIIRISYWYRQMRQSGKVEVLPSIGEVLGLFKYSSFLVTDSFHGTVLALLFNKNFVDILPNDNTGTRIESILRMVHLEDRLVKNVNDFSFFERPIEYSTINEILEEKRLLSLDILKSMIEA